MKTNITMKELPVCEQPYEKAEAEGKGGYSRLILSLNRPEEDFTREKEIGEVTRESFYGHEFTVITLK